MVEDGGSTKQSMSDSVKSQPDISLSLSLPNSFQEKPSAHLEINYRVAAAAVFAGAKSERQQSFHLSEKSRAILFSLKPYTTSLQCTALLSAVINSFRVQKR